MKVSSILGFVLWSVVGLVSSILLHHHVGIVAASNATVPHDTFHFRDESDYGNRSFGPKEWNFVTCHDVESCPGWPTNWEDFHSFIPYAGSSNMCRDCSNSVEGICEIHQQSPVNLNRNVTDTRECFDRHRMNYVEGNCLFDEFKFEILPHVLRVYQPDYCQVEPAIDFSRGFPRKFLLKFTDIAMPSHHVQDGVQYAAEVILSHVYAGRKYDKLIGNVAVFLEEGDEDDHYDLLQLYIKRFKQAALSAERSCGTDDGSEDGDEDDENVTGFTVPLADDDEEIAPMDFVDWPPIYSNYFHPYMWVREAATEYYFRYNGSMPEPPCFEGVHWRVLRSPIKVAPSQIRELSRIYKRRLNPETCEPDTAGKPRENSKWLDFNRPLQTVINRRHKLVYCECVDWKSPKKKDKKYCMLPHHERGVSNRTWPSPSPSSAPSDSPTITASPSTTVNPTFMPSDQPSNDPTESANPSAPPSECVCPICPTPEA